MHRDVLDLNGWWHVWFDEAADWRNEPPLLPNAPLECAPRRAPSAGWQGMDEGKESLQVPGTWALTRPGHHGVAWHWRPLVIPEDWGGRVVRLRFEAVRLRAEVYLDQRLVGYDLEGLTPFEVDLTNVVRPGKRYDLAVRATNPGGSTSALDWGPIPWVGQALPPSHDFGGIWGDVSLIATGPVYIAGIRAVPQPGGAVTLCTELVNHGPRRAVLVRTSFANSARDYPYAEAELAKLRDPEGALVAEEGTRDVLLPANASYWESFRVAISRPHLWFPDDPYLYSAVVSVQGEDFEDSCQVTWGMCWREVRDGRLHINGRRFPLRAALFAGWYPHNLAFPSARLAEQEVHAAKSLGLNALILHEQPATPALLAAADRAGLMILQSRGGRERGARLMRRDGNHPCVIWWNPSSEALSRPLYFSGLPDLPRVVPRYGDLLLPGSDADRWGGWLRALQEDFVAFGLARTFTDLSAFCRATCAEGSDALVRMIEQRRLDPSYAGYAVEGWASHPTEGANGLVDPFRLPQVDETLLCQASAPLAVMVEGLPDQMRSGEAHSVSLWVLDEDMGAPCQLLLRLELRGPEGQGLSAQERVVALNGIDRRIHLGEMVLRPQGEGVCTLHTVLQRGMSVAHSGRHPFWVTSNSVELPGDVQVLDPAGRLATWRGPWRAYQPATPSRGVLVVGGDEAQREALVGARDRVRRIAWLLSETQIGAGLLQTISALAAARTPVSGFALREGRPGGWVYGHGHGLLAGVAGPGVWGATHRGLSPIMIIRGLPADTLVGGCSFPAWPQDPAAPPRLGTALGIVSLGATDLLLCTLPITEGLRQGLPVAERLLGNIAAWLAT